MQIQDLKKIEIINQIYSILKRKEKKQIATIIMIILAINLLMLFISIFTEILVINKIVRMILNSLIGIVNVILILFLLKGEDGQNIIVPKEKKIKTSPIKDDVKEEKKHIEKNKYNKKEKEQQNEIFEYDRMGRTPQNEIFEYDRIGRVPQIETFEYDRMGRAPYTHEQDKEEKEQEQQQELKEQEIEKQEQEAEEQEIIEQEFKEQETREQERINFKESIETNELESNSKQVSELKRERVDIKANYDAILLKFFQESEIKVDLNFLLAECKSLEKRGLLSIEKSPEDTTFVLMSENFTRMNGIDGLEESRIDEYSRNGIGAYENLFVTKVLFPFENTLTLQELIKKEKEGYYQSRTEMCSLLLEKMILHELEKNNQMTGNRNYTFPILLGSNVFVGLLSWAMLGIVNIFMLAGMVANVGVSGLLLLEENVLAYGFNSEIREYIDNIKRHVDDIKIEDGITEDELIIKLIFGDNQVDKTIEQFL